MDPVPRDMAVLTIGIVGQLTGLSIRMIRYYESLGLVIPYRTTGDQRRYSINDVARLLLIKDLVDQEYPISQIRSELNPPIVPTEPTIQHTPIETELTDAKILKEIRGNLQKRTQRVSSATLIEGQLSQFFNRDKK